jgi:hypothetical protein
MMSDNDDNLRARFRAMADEDEAGTPRFTAPASPTASHGRIIGSRTHRAATLAASFIFAVIALLIGMVVGTNTGFASGRVEGDRQRASIAANAMGASSQLAALRLEVARARDGLTRSVMSGRAQPASLLAIESELRTIEASIGRIEIDLTPQSAQRLQTPSSASTSSTPSTSNPMKRALAVTCTALAIATPAPSPAQTNMQEMVAKVRQLTQQIQGVPVVDLPQATVRSSVTFGGPIGVRQVSGGKVMINDGRSRQIKLFDSTLTNFALVSDSTPGTSIYYGPYGMQLIPYFGDSSLFGDFPSQTILVLNGRGDVAKTFAPPPDPSAMGSLLGQRQSGVDSKGRLIYASQAGTMVMKGYDPATGKSTARAVSPPDSAPIVRADLDTRHIDTLGQVNRARLGGHIAVVQRPDGKGEIFKSTVYPLRSPDEWAVLSDGTVGIVRSHDYHVDWISPDGARSSTPKLPFDWKRVSDAEKQKMIDSAKAANDVEANNAAVLAALAAPLPPPSDAGAGGGGRGQRGGGGGGAGGRRGGRGDLIEIASPSEIPDFYPPLRDGAALADMDGNLWILPTTSAQSKSGELVYDVVNPKRGLFERVRMPAGRSVIGFGPHGVVYLMTGDRASGFYVERTTLSK